MNQFSVVFLAEVSDHTLGNNFSNTLDLLERFLRCVQKLLKSAEMTRKINRGLFADVADAERENKFCEADFFSSLNLVYKLLARELGKSFELKKISGL